MTGKRPSITKTPSVAEYQRIRKYVIDSVLAAGNMPVRLASMRELAGEFGVSIATVQRALKELTDDGYLTARKGVGLFTNPDRAWLRGKCDVIGVLAADGRQIYFENFLWNLLASTGPGRHRYAPAALQRQPHVHDGAGAREHGAFIHGGHDLARAGFRAVRRRRRIRPGSEGSGRHGQRPA